MDLYNPSQFSFNFRDILIDEIALQGLEGIGTKYLFGLVEKRIPSTLTEKMKSRYWKFITSCDCLTIYEIPEPYPDIVIMDRLSIVDKNTGNLLDPDFYLDGPYEYHLIENDYGSSKYYYTRKEIPKKKLLSTTYEEIINEYGDRLIIVASLKERWKAIASPICFSDLKLLTPINYCLLELIGRGRQNGQLTVGNTNLTKLNKDCKLLFYNRKFLQDLDLIRKQVITQVVGGKSVKSYFLRLKRFSTPRIMTAPKEGKVRDLIQHLMAQPEHSDTTDSVVKKGFITHLQSKRLQKTINFFSFKDKYIKLDKIKKCKRTGKLKEHSKLKYISISIKSDESSQSEDETNDNNEPLKIKYHVGINIMRQAYERILDAGLKGLTQLDICQLLGVEFYTGRIICRIFKQKNLVREFLEDKGRQRTSRYIAVAATAEMDAKYAEEKAKLLKYVNETKALNLKRNAKDNDPSTSTLVVPNKKRKVDNDDVKDLNTMVYDISEVEFLDGVDKKKVHSLLKASKSPTLRQLKYANGVLKILRERGFVSGYQALTYLVSKEIDEPPMDTKALKNFVQKLISDGQIKVLRIRNPEKKTIIDTTLICAPDISFYDPRIKAKYKELSIQVFSRREKKKVVVPQPRPLTQYAYPRYMKIQKLHEFLMKLVYFDEVKHESELPHGFTSIVNLVPEMTVEFSLGNISNFAVTDIPYLKITDDLLDVKLSQAPNFICKVLLQSKSLHNSLRENLKVLATFGLLQLIKQKIEKPTYHMALPTYVFYVNRTAKIIDTSGIWPKEKVDLKSLEKSYTFNSFDDVKTFWNDVFDISLRTKIKPTVNRSKNDRTIPPLRLESEVNIYDNGARFGDGLGPCGYDSSFFLEVQRLWRTSLVKAKDMKRKLRHKVKPIKLPKPVKVKKKVIKAPKPKRKELKFNKAISCRAVGRKIDSTAIKWSKEDERIINLCKAAITIVSPASQPGSLTMRNTVAKDILSIKDPKKNRNACHKKAITLECNTGLTHEKDCVINEMRKRRHLVQKYEGLFTKLKARYKSLAMQLSKARVPMLELVWLMYQLVKKGLHVQKVACIAMNFDDFHKNYNITVSTSNTPFNCYRTPDDTVLALLKEAIMYTVMISFQDVVTSEISTTIYALFSAYDEVPLRTSIDQLRKCGAIAAKEKTLNSHLHKFHFLDIIHFSYKISVGYQRKWISKLNNEFIDGVAEELDLETNQVCVKGASAINCVLCEFVTCDVLDVISITVPSISGNTGAIMQDEQLTVQEIERNFVLKSGTLGWKMKQNFEKFSDYYKDITYNEHLESLSRNSIVFQPDTAEKVHDKIIDYLKRKGEQGATFLELKDKCGYDTITLYKKLKDIESKHVIKRVGFCENMIVLTEYTKNYSIKLDNVTFIPSPWLKFNMSIRVPILLKWAGVILNRVFDNPGSSISSLCNNLTLLTERAMLDICMFLQECQCAKLQVIYGQKVDLFSDDIEIPKLEDFNEYAPMEDIYVFPVKESLTRYATIRQKLLEDYN